MNIVKFPLEPQMQGPDVADLQEALGLLLERGAVLGDDERARRDLATALQREQETQTFGDATGKVVALFQKARRIEASGVVDAATAGALNAVLSAWGVLDQGNGLTTHVVSGEVRREDGVPLRRVRVRAVHDIDGHAVRLGDDTTDGDGRYTIRYDLLPELRRLELRVWAIGEDGNMLAGTDVVRGPKRLEIIDIVVPIAAPSSSPPLGGRVVFESGRPAEKLPLVLYRRDFGGAATKVAETTTVAGGRFAFSYDSGGKVLSLEVRTVDDAGNEVPLSRPVNDLLGVARPALNLAAPDALQPLEPEYKRLTEDVTPLVGDLQKLANAEENAQRQDLTVLNRATGWDARLLACAATAQRLGADGDVGLPVEALYGLLRAGLPSDKMQLAYVAPDVAEAALKTVRDAGIVSLDDQAVAQFKQQFTSFADKVRLSVAVPGSKSTYKEMLKASGLNDQDQAKFATAYLDHRGSPGDLWKSVHQAGLNDVQVRKLQLQGKVSFLTGSSEKLMTRIQQALDKSDPAQLAEKDLDRSSAWIDEIHAAAGIPANRRDNLLTQAEMQQLEALIPPAFAAPTVEARRNLWAEDMARKVRVAYPTQVVARTIQRDGNDAFNLGTARDNTVKLLKSAASQGFRLGQTPVTSFFKTHPGARAGLTDPEFGIVEKHVTALQRVYQVTPDNEAMAVLWALDMTSAYDVMAFAESEFMELFDAKYLELYKVLPTQGLSRLVYRKATQVSSVTYNLFSIARKLDSELPVFGMSAPALVRETAMNELIRHFPTMESLFGSMDFCECEHCRSVLSPAAYLVDLLQFVDVEPEVWKNFLERWKSTHGGQDYTAKYKKPYDALMERRPDIQSIPLTCENTNTALPYIDLVNEILEYYVAHDKLAAAAAHDTGEATTPELLAEPQNILREAYDKVRDARYPLTLPFDLWIETVRAFCDYFDAPLSRVLEVLRASDELFSPAQIYDRSAVFLESLRLSPTEIGLFASPDPLAKWYELYGFTNEAEATTTATDASTKQRIDLNSAKALSRRLGVTYKQLVELVQTAFVNPKLNQLSILQKLGVSITSVRFCRDAQNKVLYDQNQDLLDPALPLGHRLPRERAALSAGDQARFDALSGDDWQTINEIEAFEGRLDEFSKKFALPLAQINAELQGIPFEQILVLADPDAGCDFNSTILRYSDGQAADDIAFLKLNLIVRLWRKLGWTIEETDCALHAFVPANAPFQKAGLGKRPLLTALIYLAHLKTLDERIRVGKQSRVKLATLWGNLPTTGKKSLYEQLFLNRAVLQTDDVFDHPLGHYLSPAWIAAAAQKRHFEVQLENVKAVDEIDPAPFAGEPRLKMSYDALNEVQHLSLQGVLTEDEKAVLIALSPNPVLPRLLDAVQTKGEEFTLIKGHLLALQGGLGLTADDVRRILEDIGKSLDTAALSLDHVSLLYRYGFLAKGLKLSVGELIALKQLSGLDPFKTLHPDPLTKLEEDYPFTQTLRFVEVAEKVKATTFTLEDLEYLLRHRFDETGKYRPNRESTLTLLKRLSDGIRTIRSENALPADPGALGEDVLRQKLGLVRPPDVVERFLAMMNGTAEFTASKSSVAPADQLKAEEFSGESAFKELVYSAARQEQKLTYRGVLLDPDEKAALLDRLPKPVPPNPHVASAVLSDLLDDVQEQARAFFEKHLQKQAANVQPATGFLNAADFPLLFAPAPAGSTEAQQQDRVRQQRTRLANAFLPFLQEQLIRQLVVQTLTAHTAADPVLAESLLTDVRLLGLIPSGGGTTQSLLAALAASGDRGLSADFFASTDGTGAVLASLVFADADTGLRDMNNTLIRPQAARSATFDGYLEVPAAGAYRFFVALDKQNAAAEVHFEQLPGGLFWSGEAPADHTVLGDKPNEYIDLKPGVLYRFSVKLRNLGGGDARILAQGEANPKDRLSQLVLYPLTTLSGAERAVTLLTKGVALAQRLNLSDRELRYLLTHASDFGELDLKMLPTGVEDDSLAGATVLFAQFVRLHDYVRVRSAIAEGTDDLIGVFETNQAIGINKDKVYSAIAKLTRRDEGTVKATAKAIATAPAFSSDAPLSRLWDALEVIERFGVPVASVASWTRIVGAGASPTQRFTIARDLKEAVKARFEPGTWQRVAQPIFDKLRQRQRDALVNHVKHQHGFARVEQLYEYFLIDPGMEPVVQTSRIRLAIGSVQLFIQRCLLNLEPNVPPAAIINAGQWEWMKRYRVWEANRKIFLFPENWLEPEFRDDKSHLFTELEGALLQGDVSNDLVEDAFLTYLRKLEELARLDIVAMHFEDKTDPAKNTLHVIGRTHAEPHKYFYRRYVHRIWTAWEPITADVEGDHLAPIVWRDRLYIFWVTFLEKPKQTGGEARTIKVEDPVSVAAAESELEAQLHWSEYLQGEWTTRESGPLNPPDMQRLKARSTDPRTVFVHVSKEPYENGEERGVYVHLSGPFNQAFYLAGRNSIPVKATFSSAPANPYSASTVNATQYAGSGRLKVTFNRRITTGQSGSSPSPETPSILDQNAGSYTILPCNNNITFGAPDVGSIAASDPAAVKASIESGLAEIASLSKPLFYQDNRHTLFVEPNVIERTIEEWQEWITRSPQPERGWTDSQWWKEIPVKAEIPRKLPAGPGNPPWFDRIDPASLVKVRTGEDWLVNPATVLMFGGELVGPGGRVDATILSAADVGTALADGGLTVDVHPGSSIGSGSTSVLLSTGSVEQAGLKQVQGGLNVIGGSGLNSTLVQNVDALARSGFAGNPNTIGAGPIGR
ncbi:neuraminidase-like domain-containing protein [Arthrobacter sp. P2b]|uniref:neuraminidase-like domain-containing protein n=1 Tax=Arthrobacter sp. P2b TaxID=1938741 RepID=UPI0009A79139|nr:neuraminidase-like domain-containing protein [Arthrobacter sp. P2b]SLK00937.1 Putative peptidoglycan binding domain-containing protein [Arthrobacter sp. P2b]